MVDGLEGFAAGGGRRQHGEGECDTIPVTFKEGKQAKTEPKGHSEKMVWKTGLLQPKTTIHSSEGLRLNGYFLLMHGHLFIFSPWDGRCIRCVGISGNLPISCGAAATSSYQLVNGSGTGWGGQLPPQVQ